MRKHPVSQSGQVVSRQDEAFEIWCKCEVFRLEAGDMVEGEVQVVQHVHDAVGGGGDILHLHDTVA